MRKPVGKSPERVETDRILNLPTKEWPDAEQVEIESFNRLQVEAFTAGHRLRPAQAAAMIDWQRVKGGLYPLPVGTGKSLTALMIAQDALMTGIARKCLYLLPVPLVVSLVKSHVPMARRWIGLPFNFHHFAGLSKHRRLALARSNAPGVYVLPYSLLSTEDTEEVLRLVDADIVVADEVHNLKRKETPRTKRLMTWMKQRETPPMFVGMSGSVTRKSILDFHHLADAALKAGSPLPRSPSMAFSWSLVLDADAAPPPGLTESTLKPLMQWAGETHPRRAFQKRFLCTPGIVASAEDRPDASLLIYDAPCNAPSQKALDLMKKVENVGETPEDEPIAHAINQYKWMFELSAGFYNSLPWPDPTSYAKNHRLSVEEAQDRIFRAQVHHEAEKVYNKEARTYFKKPEPGIDTPKRLGLAISQGRIGGPVADLWHDMKSLEFPGMPERIPTPVRVCDHKVLAALSWAKQHKHGIIWVCHIEMGKWITEVLTDFGLDPLYCPAGEADLIEAVGDPDQGGTGDRIVVASLKSHGTGRNLQAFSKHLFVQWPRDATDAEQSLGRLHRHGQKADTVESGVLISTEWDHVNRAACLSDSIYVQQLSGLPQRVIYADYDPIPRVYPPEFLRERGMQPRDLGAAGRELIQTRFGRFVK